MKGLRSLPVARGRTVRRQSGQMNLTEARYEAEMLRPRLMAGDYCAIWFERFTFRVADDCRYTPDFVVQLANGELEVHEVKGFWEDDALVKIKVAADLFPFRFVAVQAIPKKSGGGWKEREF